MKTFEVTSVNISEKKGTVKKPVEKISLTEIGIPGDAHSGSWHRQVSLLGEESIRKFSKEANREIKFGEFAENISTRGLELYKTAPLDKFISDGIELMVTQIGKKCHGDNCAIFREVGNCVMPKEGIFAKVLTGGELTAGMKFEYHPRILRINVITLSDRASQGVYEDLSGPAIQKKTEEFLLSKNRHFEFHNQIIPDDSALLKQSILKAVSQKTDIIFTTGGTGIGPRDITPDVVRPMLDKEITGIMELIRVKYGMKKPNALISRAVAGTINQTLIYTLPGSVKAVNEYLDEILPTLEHSLYMMNGLDLH
ncbi:MAG: molybdenum cofactor synthesis protein [Bacteroidales bacterium]|nr:molybdenum cofactor synthesis protein [Bacteroidales bacterium]